MDDPRSIETNLPALLSSTEITTSVDRHPVAVYLGRLAAGSRRAMEQAPRVVAFLLTGDQKNLWSMPWHEIRYQHAQALRAKLAEKYSPAMANKILAALRGVLQESWRLGQMSGEDYQRSIDVKSVRGTRPPGGRALSAGEIRALCQACDADPTAAGRRDAAILALLYGAGLRRSEAVSVHISDYEATTGTLVITMGKGNKSRIVYATNGAKIAIDSWLISRGPEAGPLLCPVRKDGKIFIAPMSDQALFFALRKRAREAGVRSFSPHDLRRSFISDLLDAGVDISVAKGLAGHASVTTTSGYDRRGEVAKRRGAEMLHMPFEERNS